MDSSALTSFDPLNEENLDKSLNMVKAVAREIHRRLPSFTVEYDDLYQNGVIGLMAAVEKYDASKGVPFLPYARFRVRGAILDGLRRTDVLTRNHRRMSRSSDGQDGFHAPVTVSASAPRPTDSGERNSIEANLPADESNSPYRLFQLEQARCLVDGAMDELPERHRRMMHLLFHDGLRASEVAKQFHVNESRVSQIRRSALRRISVQFEQQGLRCEDFLEAAC